MARCCGGGGCSCAVQGGSGVAVTGSGSSSDPIVISVDVDVDVLDTTQFNLTRTGLGTSADPWILSVAYANTATLSGLPDVSGAALTNGQVLSWNSATQLWEPAAPTVAPTGAVSHDTSLGGDGSPGDPLEVVEDPDGYLATGAAGLGLSSVGKNRIVRHFADDTDRAAASPTPTLNALSMLDDTPGRVDYWTGSQWLQVAGSVAVDADSTEYMAMSGAYDGGPVELMVRQVALTTDIDGSFEVLSVADLSGKAGVLSVDVQPNGAVPFFAVVVSTGISVEAVAYTLDAGVPYASQTINAIVTAYVY